ncbi:DUF5941 domain-containing protein [Kitasatospora azatica]|uniref:DUF5941 domain-containing protein n=1 Tax=Kitasatospora azatica TaxID=58347 RepID=UPI002D21CF8C|nr:DUF5941 domain-containing protein [Kitasatospora azatica]
MINTLRAPAVQLPRPPFGLVARVAYHHIDTVHRRRAGPGRRLVGRHRGTPGQHGVAAPQHGTRYDETGDPA